ncbi:hypothetical protein, partial [Streptomyces eurythermus]
MSHSNKPVSRRNLVQGAVLTSAALVVNAPTASAAGGDPVNVAPPTTVGEGGLLNFTQGSAALHPTARHIRSLARGTSYADRPVTVPAS